MSKLICVSDSLYNELKSRKRPGESFTTVIRTLLPYEVPYRKPWKADIELNHMGERIRVMQDGNKYFTEEEWNAKQDASWTITNGYLCYKGEPEKASITDIALNNL